MLQLQCASSVYCRAMPPKDKLEKGKPFRALDRSLNGLVKKDAVSRIFFARKAGSEQSGGINRIEILSISFRRLIERLSYVVETLREDASGGSDAK